MPIRPSLFAFTAILIASTLAAHADTVEFTFTPPAGESGPPVDTFSFTTPFIADGLAERQFEFFYSPGKWPECKDSFEPVDRRGDWSLVVKDVFYELISGAAKGAFSMSEVCCQTGTPSSSWL